MLPMEDVVADARPAAPLAYRCGKTGGQTVRGCRLMAHLGGHAICAPVEEEPGRAARETGRGQATGFYRRSKLADLRITKSQSSLQPPTRTAMNRETNSAALYGSLENPICRRKSLSALKGLQMSSSSKDRVSKRVTAAASMAMPNVKQRMECIGGRPVARRIGAKRALARLPLSTNAGRVASPPGSGSAHALARRRSATRRAISAGASSGIGKTELTLISPRT
jgi:hypothetical protein